MFQEFLQSKEWLLFQQATGNLVFDLSQPNKYQARMIAQSLPGVGKYFYLPRGPRFGGKVSEENIKEMLDHLFNLTQKEKASWIRIEPFNQKELNLIQKKSSYSIIKSPFNVQPQQNIWIDISDNLESILAKMKSKTRYNIRLSQKKKLIIKKISDINSQPDLNLFNQFWKLIQKTSQRQKIKSHPYNYYLQMLKSLPSEIKTLYLAQYQNEIIAGVLIIFYKNVAIYLHGAFNSDYRSLMAPFLLHWKAIQEAKQKKCEWYDMGGVKIVEKEKIVPQSGSWKGITRFKLGFSKKPQIINYPGTYDIVFKRNRYNLYKLLRKVKRFIG